MFSKNRFKMVLACLIVISSTAAWADDGPPRLSRGNRNGNTAQQKHPPSVPGSAQIEKMIERMSKALSLSADQKETITALHIAHFEKVRDLQAERQERNEKAGKQRHLLRLEFDKQMRDQLTDEQQSQFDQMIKKRPQRPGPKKAKRK